MQNTSKVLGFLVGDTRTNVSLEGGLVPGLGVSWQPGNKHTNDMGPDKHLVTSKDKLVLSTRLFKDHTPNVSTQTANTSWSVPHNISQDLRSTYSGTNDTYQHANTTRSSWSSSFPANVTDTEEIAGYTDRKLSLYDTNGSLVGTANGSLAYAQTASLTTPHSMKHDLWTLPTPEMNASGWTNFTPGYLYYTDLGNGTRSPNLTTGMITGDNGTAGTSIPDGYLSGYTTEHIILASIVVTLLMIVIVVGNALVIMAIAVDRNLRALQNWFIASLAVSDLLVGLLIMPFSLANELMGYWYFGNVLCELWLATDVLLCTASILNLCLISLDRYWSVTRAISYVKQRTKKRAAIMIALVWALSAIICFPPLVGWKRPQPTMYGLPLCVLSEDIGYVVYSTLGSFYIPLIVMVVVYIKIFFAARARARRNLKKIPKPVAENGKSTSTTTTSFSTPSRCHGANKQAHEEDKDLNSNSNEDDNSCQTDGHAECPDPVDKGTPSYKLSVPQPHIHYKALDEKRKLLSDDTDSACDSPIKRIGHRTGKKIHFSEETDSTSDTTSTKLKFPSYKSGLKDGSSENMRPLLEDSQLESDSQRETERQLPHNNNVESDKGTVDTPVDSSKEDHEGGPAGKGASLAPVTHPNEHKQKRILVLSPAAFRKSSLNTHKDKNGGTVGKEKQQKRVHHKDDHDPEKQKKKIARAKERRAFIVLGIIMATFILCWLPFFSTYLISSIFGFPVPTLVFAIFFWGGYCNSALNPVIYTIFNQDFRKAFHKIVCGRRAGY